MRDKENDYRDGETVMAGGLVPVCAGRRERQLVIARGHQKDQKEVELAYNLQGP